MARYPEEFNVPAFRVDIAPLDGAAMAIQESQELLLRKLHAVLDLTLPGDH